MATPHKSDLSTDEEVLDRLAALHERAKAVRSELQRAVRRERDNDATWNAVGEALGISQQLAYYHFGGDADPSADHRAAEPRPEREPTVVELREELQDVRRDTADTVQAARARNIRWALIAEKLGAPVSTTQRQYSERTSSHGAEPFGRLLSMGDR